MRLGCLLPLLTIGLLIGGGQGVYTAATNRAPKVYDIDDFKRAHPQEKWLRITGGTVDLVGAKYKSGLSGVSELFVPLRSAHEKGTDKVHILISTKDEKARALIEESRKLDEKGALKFVLDHSQELFVHRDVEGLVRYGIDLNSKEVRKLRALDSNLAENFVIIEEGKHPEMIFSFLMLVGGLALGWFLISGGKKRGTDDGPGLNPPPLPPEDPPLRETSPPLRQ